MSPAYVVSTMIRALGNSLRIPIIASTPFSTGIWRSIKVTSGRCNRNCLIASCPSEASATNFMSDSPLTSAAIPWRRRAWSSTARIRIGPPIGLCPMLMICRLSCGITGIQDHYGIFRKPRRREQSARLPCPLRLRSRSPIVPLYVSRVHGSRATPSVRRAHPHPGLSGQCPFRHPGYASEASDHRNESRLRSDVHVRGGKHFVTLRARSGTLRPGGSDTNLSAPLLRSHGKSPNRGSLPGSAPVRDPSQSATVQDRSERPDWNASLGSHRGPPRLPAPPYRERHPELEYLLPGAGEACCEPPEIGTAAHERSVVACRAVRGRCVCAPPCAHRIPARSDGGGTDIAPRAMPEKWPRTTQGTTMYSTTEAGSQQLTPSLARSKYRGWLRPAHGRYTSVPAG